MSHQTRQLFLQRRRPPPQHAAAISPPPSLLLRETECCFFSPLPPSLPLSGRRSGAVCKLPFALPTHSIHSSTPTQLRLGPRHVRRRALGPARPAVHPRAAAFQSGSAVALLSLSPLDTTMGTAVKGTLSPSRPLFPFMKGGGEQTFNAEDRDVSTARERGGDESTPTERGMNTHA